jgi:hypothetical protein
MSNMYSRPPRDPSEMHASSMAALTPTQLITLIVGVVMTIFGIIGFAVTGFDNFASSSIGDTLLGFEMNPMFNAVSLVVGIAGLVLWRNDMQSRAYCSAIALLFAVAFVYGLFVVDSTDATNFLSLNAADLVLYAVTALVGGAGAAIPARALRTSKSDSGGTAQPMT